MAAFRLQPDDRQEVRVLRVGSGDRFSWVRGGVVDDETECGDWSARHAIELPRDRELEIVLAREPLVELRVLDAASGALLPSFQIRLRRSEPPADAPPFDGVLPSGFLDVEGGSARLSLRPGDYSVTVRAEGRGEIPRTLSVGPWGAELEVAFPPTRSVAGRVSFPSGAGAGLVTVHAQVEPSPGGPLVVATSRATAGGAFRLDGLPPGRVALWADGSPSWSHRPVTLDPDVGEEPIELRLEPAARVEGLLHDSDGELARGWLVRARPADWVGAGSTEASAVTDSRGRFALDGVPLGEVRFTAVPAADVGEEWSGSGDARALDCLPLDVRTTSDGLSEVALSVLGGFSVDRAPR